jgi:hypothetical protein
VVEVTEHVAVEDLAKLAQAPMRFPQIAARLAVDDIGSGFAGLAHILKLANRHLCSAGRSAQELFVVVVAKLDDDQLVVCRRVHKAVLVVDAARPEPRQVAT